MVDNCVRSDDKKQRPAPRTDASKPLYPTITMKGASWGNLLVRKVRRAACQARTVWHVVKRLAVLDSVQEFYPLSVASRIYRRSSSTGNLETTPFFTPLPPLYPWIERQASSGSRRTVIDFARWYVEVKAEAIGQDVGVRLMEKSRKLEPLGSCEILKRDRNLSPLVTRNSPSNLDLTQPRRKSGPRYLI